MPKQQNRTRRADEDAITLRAPDGTITVKWVHNARRPNGIDISVTGRDGAVASASALIEAACHVVSELSDDGISVSDCISDGQGAADATFGAALADRLDALRHKFVAEILYS